MRGGVVRHAAGRTGGYPVLQGSSGEPAPRQPAGVRFSGPRTHFMRDQRAEHDRQPCPATGTGIAVLTRTDRALFMRGGKEPDPIKSHGCSWAIEYRVVHSLVAS